MERFFSKLLLIILLFTTTANIVFSSDSPANNFAVRQSNSARHVAKENDFLIKLREGVSYDDAAHLVKQKGGSSLYRLNQRKGQKNTSRWHRVTLSNGQVRKTVMDDLRSNPRVEYVEPNFINTRQIKGRLFEIFELIHNQSRGN